MKRLILIGLVSILLLPAIAQEYCCPIDYRIIYKNHIENTIDYTVYHQELKVKIYVDTLEEQDFLDTIDSIDSCLSEEPPVDCHNFYERVDDPEWPGAIYYDAHDESQTLEPEISMNLVNGHLLKGIQCTFEVADESDLTDDISLLTEICDWGIDNLVLNEMTFNLGECGVGKSCNYDNCECQETLDCDETPTITNVDGSDYTISYCGEYQVQIGNYDQTALENQVLYDLCFTEQDCDGTVQQHDYNDWWGLVKHDANQLFDVLSNDAYQESIKCYSTKPFDEIKGESEYEYDVNNLRNVCEWSADNLVEVCEVINCEEGYEFNEETCTCELIPTTCNPTLCPPGQYQDKSCDCVTIPDQCTSNCIDEYYFDTDACSCKPIIEQECCYQTELINSELIGELTRYHVSYAGLEFNIDITDNSDEDITSIENEWANCLETGDCNLFDDIDTTNNWYGYKNWNKYLLINQQTDEIIRCTPPTTEVERINNLKNNDYAINRLLLLEKNVCHWGLDNLIVYDPAKDIEQLITYFDGCSNGYTCNIKTCLCQPLRELNCCETIEDICGDNAVCNDDCKCESIVFDDTVPDCSDLSGECITNDTYCFGETIKASDCDCCTENLFDCNLTNPYECLSQEECSTINAYWCDNQCQEEVCCDKNTLVGCTTRDDCLQAGGNWCNEICISVTCNACSINSLGACHTKDGCEEAGGYWYISSTGSGLCSYYTCSPHSTNYCFTQTACENAQGYWCKDYCQDEECPVCSKLKPFNCLTQTACEKVGNYWCELTNDAWCQQNECTGGAGVCDTDERCDTSIDCTCPTDFNCNPTNPKADYRGCVFAESKEGDDYCDTSNEDCNTSTDCECPSSMTCDPNSTNADLKGCVTSVNLCGDEPCDQFCGNNEDCSNSIDCACPSDTYCEPKLKECVLYDNVDDKRCRANEDCESNPLDCACPNGYYCEVGNTLALINGCVPEKPNYYNIHTCRLGDDCLINPACTCAPGEKCDPTSNRADDFGCIPKTTCPTGENCCGNRICESGECGSCPVDCKATECSENGVCDLLLGENCDTQPTDCPCAEGYECNTGSIYSNKKGCVPEDNAFCGNGVQEPGEDFVSCCIDAGCGEGMTCAPNNGRLINTSFTDIYYNPKSYSCQSSVCGNGLLEEGETEDNCCIDAGCSKGNCELTDLDEYQCVVEDTCGNGQIEDYETSINCCIDIGCPNGFTCSNGKCEQVTEYETQCNTDDDCLCIKGCGVMSESEAQKNPKCTNTDLKCSNVLPICNNGYCEAKLVSNQDNEIIDYISSLKEIKARLRSFDETIIEINQFLEKARDFYKSINDVERVGFFNELLKSVREYNLDYFTLIDEIDEFTDQPSEGSINYITNRLSELETRLIDLIAKVMSLKVGDNTVSNLVLGGSL